MFVIGFACSVCAREEGTGICQEVSGTPCQIRYYNSIVTRRRPLTEAMQQRMAKNLLKSSAPRRTRRT